MKSRVAENTALVLSVSLVLWGGAAALAAFEGVFARQSPGTFAALAIFALGYAPATYFFDARLRAWGAGLPAGRLGAGALALDALLATLALFLVEGSRPEPLACPLFSIAIFFLAPVALALHAALLDRALRARAARRSKPPAARSPGARPAAT